MNDAIDWNSWISSCHEILISTKWRSTSRIVGRGRGRRRHLSLSLVDRTRTSNIHPAVSFAVKARMTDDKLVLQTFERSTALEGVRLYFNGGDRFEEHREAFLRLVQRQRNPKDWTETAIISFFFFFVAERLSFSEQKFPKMQCQSLSLHLSIDRRMYDWRRSAMFSAFDWDRGNLCSTLLNWTLLRALLWNKTFVFTSLIDWTMSPWKCSSAMNIQQDTSSSLDQQKVRWNNRRRTSLSSQWTNEILRRGTRFSLVSLSNSSTPMSICLSLGASIEVTPRGRSETFSKNSFNRSLFSPGSESFLMSLRHKDASSAIGQRLDQFSPTIELRSDDEERQIADQMCSSRIDDEGMMISGVLCGGGFHPDDQMDMPLDMNISIEDLVHLFATSSVQINGILTPINLALFSVESADNRDLMRAVRRTVTGELEMFVSSSSLDSIDRKKTSPKMTSFFGNT